MYAHRKVLLVSYYFPEEAGTASRNVLVGSERVRKFAKYLPRHGYDPIVLASSRRARERASEGVYFARELFREDADEKIGAGVSVTPAAGPVGWREILRPYLLPDRTTYTWSPWAVRLGLHLAQSHRPSIIFSSSPPFSAHLVGFSLGHFLHVPWVADFRDGYSFEPPEWNASGREARACLEGFLLRWAARVVSVTEPITRDFSQRFPGLIEKFVTIPNGYDAEEIRQAVGPGGALSPSPAPGMTLLYAGASFLSSRDQTLKGLMGGFRQACRVLGGKPLRLRLMGLFAAVELQEVAAWPGPGEIEIIPWGPKIEALRAMASADLLIVLAGKRVSVATSKLFDYIGVGRPILVIGRPSAAAEIVEQFGFGQAVEDDADAVARALVEFGRTRGATMSGAGDRDARGDRVIFSREELAGRLASLFTEALGDSRIDSCYRPPAPSAGLRRKSQTQP